MRLARAFQIEAGEIVALVGGGGKSSLMFSLGRELAAAGRRTLLTTTTKIFARQLDLAPASVIFNSETESPEGLMARLETALAQHGQVILSGPIDSAGIKATGIEPEIINRLAQSGLADVILNEADGAKRLPFKAPAPHEPVIPGCTSLVVPVVGLDILGKPLNEEYAHRSQLIAQLSQTELGSPVTAQTIAAVITHPLGGLKSVPATARVIPFLNKLDVISVDEARALARLILRSERISAVAIGSAQATDPISRVENRVAAIVLAAGGASRFGSTKQLAVWRGKPLLLHAVDAALASEASPVIVVLGADADACRATLGDRPVQIVENEAWADGQSTSMRAGLAALPETIGGAIFPLADQPLITADIIDAVIDRYRQTLAPVVWPEFESKRGNPVLFDRSLFAEMMSVSGDVGAKPVLLAHQTQAERVAVTSAGILKDVDTLKDLASDNTSAKIEGQI